jgi:tetratricopeptide (TPR) repeat protein
MSAETEEAVAPGVKRPIVLSPLLVALAALALYGLTLNGWVTFGSLPFASQIMGWDWHPHPLPWRPTPQYPLLFVLTFPLRWLPAGWRVAGLNLFAAVCAALTLAILARSVRLLAHDRTKEQRRRVSEAHALLPVRAAFLPALFAVLLLAAQLTFWENAVSGTGQMLNLLVFAFLILSLLEFRVSREEWRLNLFAFVYGVGVANNWALIGFFPCFILALIWIKRMELFNWKFALRMIGWGALGLLLYGLIPLLCMLAHDGGFWEILRQKLAEQRIFLTRIPRYYTVIAAAPTLIPLFFAAIKWPLFDNQGKPELYGLRLLFRVLHVVFLAVGVLMFFDVRFSPNPRNMGFGVAPGTPGFLTFYYLAALSVGYFSGFVLLVFGKDIADGRGLSGGIPRASNGVVVGLLWVAAIGLPAMLFRDNFLHIRDFNSRVVFQFGKEMAASMPGEPAVVLADDPARLYLAVGAGQSLRLPNQYIFVESGSLVHREYLRYLANRYPPFGRELPNPDRLPDLITDQQAGSLLAHLTQRMPVFCLHPSFGSLLDGVCMTPHRLGGYLHPYPTNVLETLALSPGGTATNQAYWRSLEKDALASLPELAKGSPDARRIAGFYSQMLDYWGVELQKTATRRKLPLLLEDANVQFAEALRLNPNNVVARANQQFNARLRGVPPAGLVNAISNAAARLNNHWATALDLDGPADVPDLDIQIGRYFAQRGTYHQAAPYFQRSLELAANNPAAELDLANTYINLGLLDAASILIRDMHKHFTGDPLELAGVEVLACIARDDFTQADKLLADARNKYPKDQQFIGVSAELYRVMGNKVLRESEGNPAREKSAENDAAPWFKKSLAALDERLRLLEAAMARAQEIYRVNLSRVEMQMALKDYDAAISNLTELAPLHPQNPAPLLNLAICELQINRLGAAKKDYQSVEEMMREPSPQVYYGLAQIAQKQNDKAAEIRYSKLYLQHAPRGTPEFAGVSQRLLKLEGR